MKKSIWIKALELRKMTTSQLAKYEINTRITNPDEPSDHELLMQLIKEVKEIKITLNNVIKLNNLRTK